MDEQTPHKLVVELWMNHWPALPKLLDPVRELAQEFNHRHPEYEVIVRGVDVRTMSQELEAAAAEDRAPQLATVNYLFAQHARDIRHRSGVPLFAPLDDAIGGRTEILGEPVVVDDLVPTVRNSQIYEGRLQAMPRNPSTTLMYVNMTMLAAAGVTRPPRTWQEVRAACEAVAADRGRPSQAITWPNQGWFFEQAVASQGGLLVDHDNGRSGRAEKIDLSSPAMLAFVNWWRDLNRDGHFVYSGKQMDWFGCYDLFVNKDVAILFNSSVEAGPLVRDARENGFSAVAAPLPYNAAVPYAGNPVACDGIWMAGGLDDAVRDGALAFLQYMLTPEHAAVIHSDGRMFMPVTEASIMRLENQAVFARQPQYLASIDQIRRSSDSSAARGAAFGNFRTVQDVITQAMHDVLVDDVEPSVRFAQATVDAQMLLDAYIDGVTSGR